jgi:hypothetical protein
MAEFKRNQTMRIWSFLPIIFLIGWATVEKPAVARISLTDQPTTTAEYPVDKLTVAQITSVSQYRDVLPADYYFSDLQSLVENYGISLIYPDETFRGNRTVTRYEFISIISQSLNQMEQVGIRLTQPLPVAPPDNIVDVLPTDWAFEAIRNLMERYEVNLLYPDGTFRGNSALTVNELISYLNQMVGANLQLSDLRPYLPSDTAENTATTRGTYAVILNQSLQEAEARESLFR